ncbi:MAG: winged helix-turn-helix domain-containing protein [Candidatus Thorarchaeota archaeon]
MNFISKVKESLYNVFVFNKQDMDNGTDYKSLLQGMTLKVYWYLLTRGEMGIRELQRDLKVSSPGTITYQMKKLIEAGLVEKNAENDKYFIKEEVKSGILGFYVRFGYKMIPRFSLYLIVYFSAVLWFLINTFTNGDSYMTDINNLVFLMYIIFGICVFIFESYKIWKMNPDQI